MDSEVIAHSGEAEVNGIGAPVTVDEPALVESVGDVVQTRMEYPNGDVYVGELSDGIRSGHGVYSYAKGPVYVGPFAKGMRHGIGNQTFVSHQNEV